MQIPGKTLKIAAKGDLGAVKALRHDEPRLLNTASNGHNRTLLWAAARGGKLPVVECLVENGADVNIPGRYRYETFVLVKPYSIAVTKKRYQAAEYLLKNDPEIDLYTAAYLGWMDVLETWVEKRPTSINQHQPEETIGQVTALHHAVSGRHVEAARLLIEAGAEVATHAPLLFDIACRRARMDLIELLVATDADPVQADAFSVVHSNDPAIIDYFFSQGCTVDGGLTSPGVTRASILVGSKHYSNVGPMSMNRINEGAPRSTTQPEPVSRK